MVRISQNASLQEISFSIQAIKKPLHYIHYQYVEDKEGYVKISRQYSCEKDSIQQTFYLKEGKLIFAKEKITSFIETGRTEYLSWSGEFYFSNGKLIDLETLGHGKSEIETWQPE